jgi:hypothetical protein
MRECYLVPRFSRLVQVDIGKREARCPKFASDPNSIRNLGRRDRSQPAAAVKVNNASSFLRAFFLAIIVMRRGLQVDAAHRSLIHVSHDLARGKDILYKRACYEACSKLIIDDRLQHAGFPSSVCAVGGNSAQ